MTINRARSGLSRPGAATPTQATRQNVTPTSQHQASSFRVGELARAASITPVEPKKPKDEEDEDKETLFTKNAKNDEEVIGITKDAATEDKKDKDKKDADEAVGVKKAAGDADDFEPLHGDLTVDEDDSNANSTTPAHNDTGVPSTPSGVKAPSNA